MVYNIWMSWVNGSQGVDIIDKCVKFHLSMVVPMVPLMSKSSRVSDVS